MKRWVLTEGIPAAFASHYEKAARLVRDHYYPPLADEIVSSLGSGTILDLGTGPGYLPIAIAQRSSSIRCDGVDLNQRLIEMARANALHAGVAERANFEVGNAAELRFEEASYDMVISTGMLHMLRDPVKVLQECERVLRPGGEAWIYDPARISSQMDVAKWKASLTMFERLSYVLFKLYVRFNPPHHYNRHQIEEMIGATRLEAYSIEAQGIEIQVKMRK